MKSSCSILRKYSPPFSHPFPPAISNVENSPLFFKFTFSAQTNLFFSFSMKSLTVPVEDDDVFPEIEIISPHKKLGKTENH